MDKPKTTLTDGNPVTPDHREALASGGDLALQIDWSDFKGAMSIVHCRCDATFRSHHKLHQCDDGQLRGVSQNPCPDCRSHLSARRVEYPPETMFVTRSDTRGAA